jgi:hypothetical protein
VPVDLQAVEVVDRRPDHRPAPPCERHHQLVGERALPGARPTVDRDADGVRPPERGDQVGDALQRLGAGARLGHGVQRTATDGRPGRASAGRCFPAGQGAGSRAGLLPLTLVQPHGTMAATTA